MKVSCLQENLAKGLSIVGRAVAARSTLPVLGNILLATENGRLKLAATNLDIGITHWIGAKVETEGSITVPARQLTDYVNSLPPDTDANVKLQVPGRLLEAGLLAKREEEDEPRPRFRDRLMFAILDQASRHVGFGGRLMGPGEPKYLNSAESPAFHDCQPRRRSEVCGRKCREWADHGVLRSERFQ